MVGFKASWPCRCCGGPSGPWPLAGICRRCVQEEVDREIDKGILMIRAIEDWRRRAGLERREG